MEELRRHPRNRTFKGALIEFNNGASSFSCTVKNISEGGALLVVASVIGIPDVFDLHISGNPDRIPCIIVRREIDKLHVRFL